MAKQNSMENLEININEDAVFERWEYKHFIKNQEKQNILKTRVNITDIPLFKSDFIEDVYYFSYIVLKYNYENEQKGNPPQCIDDV